MFYQNYCQEEEPAQGRSCRRILYELQFMGIPAARKKKTPFVLGFLLATTEFSCLGQWSGRRVSSSKSSRERIHFTRLSTQNINMRGVVSFLKKGGGSSPLFGATVVLPQNEVVSSPGGIIYGDTSTLNYPPLLSPLISPRFYTSIALICAGLFAVLRQRFVSFLRRTKIRDVGFYGFLLLLVLQEVRLTDRLLQDFRPITSGKWSLIDNYIVHYIERRSTTMNPTSHVHAFHGFGANSLSFRPLMDALAKGGNDVPYHPINTQY